MKYIWIAGGWLCVGLALLGIALPLLPTPPFLLLAALCFSRGSERLYAWLIYHPKLGPPIRDWQTNKIIRRPVKLMATVTMIGVLLLSFALDLAFGVIAIQAAVMAGVLVFIWRQREV